MKTSTINLSIPKDLLDRADKVAKSESRSRSELMRSGPADLPGEAYPLGPVLRLYGRPCQPSGFETRGCGRSHPGSPPDVKRVVFDTNIWVSALVFRGRVLGLLDRLILDEFKVVISPDLLAETLRVLGGRKFKIPPEVLTTRDQEIRELCLMVYPTRRIQAIQADPSDDRVLECAVAAKAEIIISGDAHLLSLGEYQGIRILAPAAFLAELDGPITDEPQAREAPALYKVKGKKKKRAQRRKT